MHDCARQNEQNKNIFIDEKANFKEKQNKIV